MKLSLATAALLLLATCIALAQAPSNAPSAEPSFKVAPGTIIPAELSKSLDSKKAKEGDPVVAKVSADLLSDGAIIVPRNSRITGHVTEAKARGKGESESTLGMVFDRLILKNGQEIPLNAVVQAVGAPVSSSVPTAADENPGGPKSNPGGYGSPGGMGSPRPSAMPGNPSGTQGPDDQPGASPGPRGHLAANATGVVGISGVTLRTTSSASSVLASEKKNVKLDSGTQLLLRTANP